MPGRLITTASADVALKGLAYLLEAVAKLRTERDVTLTIIGKPKPGGQAADLIERSASTDAVQFVSGVTDERIVELYAEAELAVVPSLYEGFSLPAVEAMATGTCLVATDGGALPEVTGRDGETVLVVPRPATSTRWPPRCGAGLDDPDLRAACRSRPGASGSSSAGAGATAPQLTVDQYREVLAMPANIASRRLAEARPASVTTAGLAARLAGRRRADAHRPLRAPRPAARATASSTSAAGSAATPSKPRAAAPASWPSTTPRTS